MKLDPLKIISYNTVVVALVPTALKVGIASLCHLHSEDAVATTFSPTGNAAMQHDGVKFHSLGLGAQSIGESIFSNQQI